MHAVAEVAEPGGDGGAVELLDAGVGVGDGGGGAGYGDPVLSGGVLDWLWRRMEVSGGGGGGNV